MKVMNSAVIVAAALATSVECFAPTKMVRLVGDGHGDRWVMGRLPSFKSASGRIICFP
jgi:hypothetical protein